MQRTRILILAMAVLAAGMVLIVRLAQLQLIEADEWRAEAELLSERQRTIPYRRGAILDRTGKPIAYDVDTYSLDFEYRAFRMRNPLAQAAHVLLGLQNSQQSATGEPITLPAVAAAPERAAELILRTSPARIAEMPSPAERGDVRLSLERMLGLNDRASRTRLREAVRSKTKIALGEMFPEPAKTLGARIAQAAADFAALDKILGKENGFTLDRLENERLDILVDVEAALAARTQDSAEDENLDIALEREKARRQRETWLARFESDVPYEAAEWVSFRSDRFVGFTAGPSTVRRYAESALPWIVGTVRALTAEELRQARADEDALLLLSRKIERTPAEQQRYEKLKERVARSKYPPGDLCGSEGVERAFEADLHGKRGSVVESVGRRGGKADRIDVEAPADGKDVTLTIDLALQRAAEEVLRSGVSHYSDGSLRGSIVVIDVRNGDVLAIAANPDFERTDLKDKNKFAKLLRLDADPKNPSHPLHHRGYRPWLPPTPGSTFKVVTALAALERGIVGFHTTHVCDGKIGTLRCEGVHGSIDLAKAMEVSCNSYFGWLGEKLGLEEMRRASERFGFAAKTGFDPLEVKGGFEIARADAELLRRCGVGYQIGVTPLQVARAYAAIANGGSLVKLRSVRRVGDRDVPPEILGQLGYSQEYLAGVRSSLRAVVFGDRGTARDTGLAAFDVAGKTGTAEVDSTRDLNHAWFAGYAPVDKPRIAFAVYAELVPLHGKDVAPIARQLLSHEAFAPYFGGAK